VTNARDLDWWDTHDVASGIRIRAVPARHWSARNINDADRTLWMGFVIESDSGDVYFAGDTGYTRDFDVIREHYAERGRLPFRLALLPIAPGRPHDAMASRHMNATDAVRAYEHLDARRIHAQAGDGCILDFKAVRNGGVLNVARIKRGDLSTSCPPLS
jgi:N-acyl-phosphatidylethanolamine-hydrolysing phospholipase D